MSRSERTVESHSWKYFIMCARSVLVTYKTQKILLTSLKFYTGLLETLFFSCGTKYLRVVACPGDLIWQLTERDLRWWVGVSNPDPPRGVYEPGTSPRATPKMTVRMTEIVVLVRVERPFLLKRRTTVKFTDLRKGFVDTEGNTIRVSFYIQQL